MGRAKCLNPAAVSARVLAVLVLKYVALVVASAFIAQNRCGTSANDLVTAWKPVFHSQHANTSGTKCL